MNLPRPDIFISATSADLGPIRELVKNAVLDLGAHPNEQQHFAPAGQTVAGMLRTKIGASHAVIHLVGECYGFEDATLPAASEHRTYAEGRRSYTQLEHDLALELGKPIYVFLCGENFPYAPHDAESEEKQVLQRAHRARLGGGNHLYRTIDSLPELRENILRLEDRTRLLGERAARSERHLARTVALGALAVVLLTGGGWWLKERVFRGEERAARGESRVQQVEKKVDDEIAIYRESVRLLAARYNEVQSPGEQLTDEEKFQRALAKVAEQEKIPVGELRARIDTFVAQVRARDAFGKADFYDLGLAAFAEKNFQKAAELAVQASQAADAKMATGQDLAQEGAALLKQGQELIAKGREDKRQAETLAGDAEDAARHYPTAAEHYRAAAALYDRPTEPLAWAGAQAKLGNALWRDGKYAASATVWQGVLAERERHLPADDLTLLATLNNLALVTADAGDQAAAEPLYRRALEANQRVLGAEHPNTLTSISNLAVLLRAKGDNAGAEPLYRRALEVRERVLGAEHPDTLGSMNNLAALLSARGDYPAAEPLYRRALAGQERVLGAEHPDTLNSVNNLAELLRSKGDYATAEPLYRRALAARERLLGAEHPSTLGSVNNLALLLKSKGDDAAAEPLYRRVLAGYGRVLGPEHPYTCLAAYNLAFFLMKRERQPEAVPLAWQAYRGWLQSKGAQHEDTRDARELLLKLGEKVPE